MSAFTPGPWIVRNLEPSTFGHDWVDGPNHRFVAVCHEIVGNGPHGYSLRVDTDEVAANARLISAAPDLLAALKWARTCVPYPSDCHTAIVAAIAKAEAP